MSDLRRYTHYDICHPDGFGPKPTGVFVDAEDYDALAAQFRAVQEERDKLAGQHARQAMTIHQRQEAWQQERERAEAAEAEVLRLRAQLESREEPSLETVLTVWNRWRASLTDGAFTHSDGLRFVRDLTAAYQR